MIPGGGERFGGECGSLGSAGPTQVKATAMAVCTLVWSYLSQVHLVDYQPCRAGSSLHTGPARETCGTSVVRQRHTAVKLIRYSASLSPEALEKS